jgi:hypothetical protein
MSSPTFGQLAARGETVIYSCMAPGPHKEPLRFTGQEGAARFGAEVTIEQVRVRLRCRCCGHRGRRIILEVHSTGPPAPMGLGDRGRERPPRPAG